LPSPQLLGFGPIVALHYLLATLHQSYEAIRRLYYLKRRCD
jgi:hypothetical protein